MRRGRWLEPAVGKAVTELRPEWGLEVPGVFLCDTEIGIGATPDFYITGDPRGRGVLQIKTVAPSVYAREWDNGKEIPLWVTLQTLTEAMLADAAFGVTAVMLVDPHYMDVQILDVPRHSGAELRIVTEVHRFVQDVREGREPDPDFQRDGAVLKLLMPREQQGSTLDLSGDNMITAMLAKRAEVKARMAADKRTCEAIENEIKYTMGDAAMLTGLAGFQVTYKTSHFKGYTVAPRDTRVLRVRDRRPKDQRPSADNEDEDDN
jgi:hypothetical protein